MSDTPKPNPADAYETMEALLCEMQGLRDELSNVKRERDVALAQIEHNHKGAEMLEKMVYDARQERDQWCECAKEALLPLAAVKIANQETPITQICPELMDVIIAAHDLIFDRLKGATK